MVCHSKLHSSLLHNPLCIASSVLQYTDDCAMAQNSGWRRCGICKASQLRRRGTVVSGAPAPASGFRVSAYAQRRAGCRLFDHGSPKSDGAQLLVLSGRLCVLLCHLTHALLTGHQADHGRFCTFQVCSPMTWPFCDMAGITTGCRVTGSVKSGSGLSASTYSPAPASASKRFL